MQHLQTTIYHESRVLVAYANIIFDFDGTITDSKRDIAEAQLWVLAHLGVNGISTEEIFPHIGKPLDETFRVLLPSSLHHRIEEASALYSEYYPSRALRTTTLFPGVRETLKTLYENGIRLAIASTKKGHGIQRGTDHFGITYLFDQLQGSDNIPFKPDPTIIECILRDQHWGREDTLMVGDTDKDILAAHNAGIDACSVTYGAFARPALSDLRPRYLIDSFPDLLPIVLSQ